MSKTSYSSLFTFTKGIGIPILLWLAFTPWSAWLDLQMSQVFYQDGTFDSHPFWDGIYHYGIWPTWLMIGLAFAGFISSFSKMFSNWRNPCLFLILTFAIGSGLIIHAGFKDHWGRPRPKQVVEFGGKQPFRPYYAPNFINQPEPSKSFACGHASMGFTFFSVSLLGAYYRSRLMFWIGWLLAWSLGSLLSIARIVQGGHFLSDTLASALIMWLTAWCLIYYLIINVKEKNERLNS